MRRDALVLALMLVGCGLSGGSENNRPPPRPIGATCMAFESVLRGCGLLSEGTFRDCEEPETPKDRCQADCLGTATCDDFRMLLCRDEGPVSPGGAFAACLLACEPGPFQCRSGGTVRASSVCDGFGDCSDASDEDDCGSALFECPGFDFSVPESSVCDGFSDCPNGEDELDCGGNGGFFQCASGFNIPSEFRCDGDEDCGDGSDEVGCPAVQEAELICN